MAHWKVFTIDKGSVLEVEIWVKDNIKIKKLTSFNYGSWIITTNDNEIPKIIQPKESYVEILDYRENNVESVELLSLEDDYFTTWEFPDSLLKEEQTNIKIGFENFKFDFLDSNGWYHKETECLINGELFNMLITDY